MTCETHTNPTIALLKSHLKLENWVEKKYEKCWIKTLMVEKYVNI